MDLQFLGFYEIFGLWDVGWLYVFFNLLYRHCIESRPTKAKIWSLNLLAASIYPFDNYNIQHEEAASVVLAASRMTIGWRRNNQGSVTISESLSHCDAKMAKSLKFTTRLLSRSAYSSLLVSGVKK